MTGADVPAQCRQLAGRVSECWRLLAMVARGGTVVYRARVQGALVLTGPGVVRDTTVEAHPAVARAVAGEAAIERVRAVLDHARKVSPSASMTVYVADVQAAIDGAVVALPHKLGAEQ